jgi:rhamnosyltransferase subunit B
MSRILFATFGSLGDLHPALGVALEMQRRGHRAEVATVEGYRDKITALGLTFHPLRPNLLLTDQEAIRRIVDRFGGPRHLLRDVLFPAVRDMHADLSRAASGVDMLVASELVYAAPILSEHRKLTWVSYALAPMSYFSVHDPSVPPVPFVGPWVRALPPALLRVSNRMAGLLTASWWRPLRELRRELGLPPGRSPVFDGKYSARLDLALFSPVLQRPQPDWPRSTVQTGFPFFDEPDAGLPPAVEAFLGAGEPPIVFTLGSSAVHVADDFYAESARAAQQLGRRALLLVGRNPPPPGLPASILAWDYLPYAHIFPRAAAVVHSGGIGTTAQALRAGKPMLVMPFAFDQPDNAARVSRLGAGRTVSRQQYSARRAARELDVLLRERRHTETAARARALIRAENGVIRACDELERVMTPTRE